MFHKLLMNFTWWVNRKDSEGNNIFEGGFLGLDNIGVFDRSQALPPGGTIEQSDGTSWMAMYCLNMLRISQELAEAGSGLRRHRDQVLRALPLHRTRHQRHGRQRRLWDEEDGFFYDGLRLPDGRCMPIKATTISG